MPASEEKRIRSSVSSSTEKPHSLLPYVCVHCCTPCAALYRRLSVSLSSIKAMTCETCGKLVDPYIEQEPLLIAIDCILSRAEAYRHVLYNTDDLKSLPPHTIIELLIGWCVLEGYVKWQAANTEFLEASDTVEARRNLLAELAPFALRALLGLLFQWCVMQAFLTNEQFISGIRLKLFWAVFLPCNFTAVVVFVGIWESTKTIRMLSILLIAYWQGTATWVVTKDLLTPTLCLLAGILWRFLLPHLFPGQFPCVSDELQVFNHRFCVT